MNDIKEWTGSPGNPVKFIAGRRKEGCASRASRWQRRKFEEANDLSTCSSALHLKALIEMFEVDGMVN
jgi:hypothetical protein